MTDKKRLMIKATDEDISFEHIYVWYIFNFAHLEKILNDYRRIKMKVNEKNYKKATKIFFGKDIAKRLKIELIEPNATARKYARSEKPQIFELKK